VREDRPHEEDGRRQQQRQCLNESHDRPSPYRAAMAASLTLVLAHARASWFEAVSGRTCRSGRSASSAPPKEPRHDSRPHRDPTSRQ
jgi:hypothetical protein